MKILLFALIVLVFAFPAAAQQTLKVGDTAPDFQLTTLDGGQLNSGQMRGKVVLLTFWATYCQICQAELPKLNAVMESYKGKDIVFVGVTTEKAAVVKSYLKENPRNFAVVPDGFGLMMQYGDKDKNGKMDMGYPNYYLIDQNGKIAMRGSGFDKTAAIDKEIGSLLGAVKPDVKKPQ
jgi:peroxiredoxin